MTRSDASRAIGHAPQPEGARHAPLDQRLPEVLDLAEADVGIAYVVDATDPLIAGQAEAANVLVEARGLTEIERVEER